MPTSVTIAPDDQVSTLGEDPFSSQCYLSPVEKTSTTHSILNRGVDTLHITAGGPYQASQKFRELASFFDPLIQDPSNHEDMQFELTPNEWWTLKVDKSRGLRCARNHSFAFRHPEIGMLKLKHPDSFHSTPNSRDQIQMEFGSHFSQQCSATNDTLRQTTDRIITFFLSKSPEDPIFYNVLRVDPFADHLIDPTIADNLSHSNFITRARTRCTYHDNVDIPGDLDQTLQLLRSSSTSLSQESSGGGASDSKGPLMTDYPSTTEGPSILASIPSHQKDKLLLHLINTSGILDSPEKPTPSREFFSSYSKLTSVNFGTHSSSIYFRLYDKIAQARQKNNLDFIETLIAKGYDPHSHLRVFRTEGQVRTSVLKELSTQETGDLTDPFNLLSQLHYLWHYLTSKWLRHVDGVNPIHASRSVISSFWSVVQSAFQGILLSAPTRTRKFNGQIIHLYKMLLGTMKTHLGLSHLSPHQLIQSLKNDLTSPAGQQDILHRQRLLNPHPLPVT